MKTLPVINSPQLSPVDGKPFDLGIYMPLKPMSDGYIPHVKRRYMFTGNSSGQKCNFQVEIKERNPSMPDYVSVSAVFAMNVHYEPHSWIHVRDLEPIDHPLYTEHKFN